MNHHPAIISIIGGGLAGVEAAWHASRAGVPVRLYEMRPTKQTPVHQTGLLAELVCSNSLKSDLLTSASGLLKAEMRLLGSVVIECGDAHRVPAGQALAVDRERYAECVTERISSLPNVEIIREEVTELPSEGVVIVASGPLTSDALAREIARLTGRDYLYFYDAVAPTIAADSIDYDIVFRASRYGKGDADYLNCPMTEDEYNAFYDALMTAERVPTSAIEPLKLFEGCMPIEEMASRGRQALAFGPLKPVGLDDPRAVGEAPVASPVCHHASPGRPQVPPLRHADRPYAVVQLRQENSEGTLWGLVGFQTRLKWGEQERVFRMIPGLQRAEFARYGVMHRNTYIESPKLLLPTMRMRTHRSELDSAPDTMLTECSSFRQQDPRCQPPADGKNCIPSASELHPQRRPPDTRHPTPNTLTLFFAGQITGVEGYVESAAMGIIAGINAARLITGEEPVVFPRETIIGALADYISSPQTTDFQPMNANFGILPKPEQRIRNKRARQAAQVERALEAIRAICATL